jgi:RNA polymerase sigma-70 factor (ECF subfamily)
LNNVEKELEEKLDTSTLISGEEIQLKLQKALLKLPEKQRLVFNMKYFDEMKYEEISNILGTSVGALKASYHLAVKKVEQCLKLN